MFYSAPKAGSVLYVSLNCLKVRSLYNAMVCVDVQISGAHSGQQMILMLVSETYNA